MPEVRDYSFIPLFGGTQRLPRLLGLRAGMEILLGDRLDARHAARIGLIDRLAPESGLGSELRSFLAALRARGWQKRAPQAAPVSRPPPFEELPGPERRLARQCLRLARLPFQRGYRLEKGLRQELESFWHSLGRKESERAMSFFLVRQAAKAHRTSARGAFRSAWLEIPRRCGSSWGSSLLATFPGSTCGRRAPSRSPPAAFPARSPAFSVRAHGPAATAPLSCPSRMSRRP